MLQNTSQEHLVLQIQLSTNNLPLTFLRGSGVSPDCRGDKQVHKFKGAKNFLIIPAEISAFVGINIANGIVHTLHT